MNPSKSLNTLHTLRQDDGEITNNWYIIALSCEVKDRPIQKFLYEKPYVIWRSVNGEVAILPDRCLHRHTLLSEGGVVVEGRLKCPYHGWEYDSDGKVKKIPSEGPNLVEKNHFCQQKIPSLEREGVIWAWMGEKAPDPEIPPWHFPYVSEQGWHHYFMITDFTGEVTDLCENFMDVPHTVFVHKGWFRDEKKQKVPMTVETKEAQVICTYHQEKDEFSKVAQFILNPKNEKMIHHDRFIYPNLTCVDYWFGENGFIINSQVSPIHPLQSRVYTYIAYRVSHFARLINPIVRFYTRKVIEQDVSIMKNHGKSLRLDAKRIYHSTPADEVHIQIERLRQFGRKGSPQLKEFKIKKDVEFWI